MACRRSRGGRAGRRGAQIGKHLDRHPRAHEAGIDEFAVMGERPAALQHAIRLAACSVARALGRAEACRREASFLTWTADSLLRHTVYVGLREDKRATEVRREIAVVR